MRNLTSVAAATVVDCLHWSQAGTVSAEIRSEARHRGLFLSKFHAASLLELMLDHGTSDTRSALEPLELSETRSTVTVFTVNTYSHNVSLIRKRIL